MKKTTADDREAAVKMVRAKGLRGTAKAIGVAESTIVRWRQAAYAEDARAYKDANPRKEAIPESESFDCDPKVVEMRTWLHEAQVHIEIIESENRALRRALACILRDESRAP